MTQGAFVELIAQADLAERARVDRHRSEVQAFFDALPIEQKDRLGAWLSGSSDWITFQALAVAAGDWHRSRSSRRS